MSRTIDERVVEMRFDNKQFEAGIDTSIDSLNKLTRSLDLSGASKGLDNVNAASKGLGVEMSGLGSAIETVGARFSAMRVVAVTALMNITNSAINAGKQMLSSLTIAPVKMGFSEYELKMGSIQTIMAGTGEKLETVNKYLEELNAYSDRTIYSFSDMTNNIGKFTNAGVKLEDAVTAIKGVSNVAALSGANANEASRAMYNFSQALSAGYVKLIDWKSIENANMATVGFKKELIKTAVELGVVTDAGDGMYKTLEGHTFNATKNFNDVLQDQWMTTDVLVKTLAKYTDETTDLGKSAYAAAQDIKTFSMLMDTLKEAAQSGWAQTWEIIFGDFEEAKKLWTDVNEVVGTVISKSAEARNEMLKGWKDLGGRKALIEGIANAFHGVVAVLKPVGKAFRDIFPAVTAKQLYAVTEKFRQLTENFKKFLTENEKGKKLIASITSIFKGLFAVIDIGVQLVVSIAKAFGKLIKSISPVLGGIVGLAGKLGEVLVKLRNFIKETKIFDNILGAIAKALATVVNGIAAFAVSVADGFKKVMKKTGKAADDFADRVEERYKPIVKLGETLKKCFQGVVNFFKKAGLVILGIGAKIGEGIGDMFSGLWEAIKNADFNTVLDILNAALTGGLLVGVTKFVNSFSGITKTFKNGTSDTFKKIKDVLKGFGDILDSVKNAINTFTGSIKVKMLKDIAVSIAILAAAVIAMSLVNSEKLAVALGAITGLFIDLFGSLTAFQKLMGKDGFVVMEKLVGQMLGIAIATLILASAVTKLSKLGWKELGKGLAGVTGAMTVLVAATKVLSSKSTQHGAKGMLSLAISLLVLSAAIKQFSKFSLKEMGTGLLALGGALTVVIAAAYALPSSFGKKAAKLILLASALTALGGAFNIFAGLRIDEVGSGLLAMGGSLAIITAALYAIPKDTKKKASTVGKMALAIASLAGSMAILGSIPLKNVGSGLLALGGAIGIIVAALHLLPKNTAWLALGLMLVATAIAALVGPLALLGALKLEMIGKGLLTIAGVLTILGVAVYALKGHELTLLALSGALALLGVACVSISAAVVSMSGALVALAGAGSAAVALIVGVVTGIVALIPVIIENLGKGFVAMLDVLANSGAAIARGLTTILGSLITALKNNLTSMIDLVREIAGRILDVLIELTPRVMKWLGMLLEGLIKLIGENIPELIGCVGILLDSLLKFLVASVPKIVSAGVQMIMGFLQGIQDAIPKVVAKGVDIVVTLCNAVASQTVRLVDEGFKLIINFCNGLADTIRKRMPEMKKSFKNLGWAMIEGLTGSLGEGLHKVVNKAKELGRAAWNGIKDVLGIHSPSKKFQEVGKYSGEGLILGLKGMTSGVGKAAKGVGKAAVNTLSDAVSGIADIVSSNIDTTPTIRPVVDLSDVESGEKKLSKMLGKTKTISVDSAAVRAASVANGMKSKGMNSEANPTNQNGGGNFVFTQNNYSPKALSKTEIYRQTKNQISMAKNAVKAH